jgi:hypothetical protein
MEASTETYSLVCVDFLFENNLGIYFSTLPKLIPIHASPVGIFAQKLWFL